MEKTLKMRAYHYVTVLRQQRLNQYGGQDVVHWVHQEHC
jgi:hypothetical protein